MLSGYYRWRRRKWCEARNKCTVLEHFTSFSITSMWSFDSIIISRPLSFIHSLFFFVHAADRRLAHLLDSRHFILFYIIEFIPSCCFVASHAIRCGCNVLKQFLLNCFVAGCFFFLLFPFVFLFVSAKSFIEAIASVYFLLIHCLLCIVFFVLFYFSFISPSFSYLFKICYCCYSAYSLTVYISHFVSIRSAFDQNKPKIKWYDIYSHSSRKCRAHNNFSL